MEFSLLKIKGGGASVSSSSPIASFQHGVLESRLTWMFPEASLRIWMPAIHADMTKICVFMFCRRAQALG